MPTFHSRSLIDVLIDTKTQLNADANKPYEILQQRDRRIGIEYAELKSKPIMQVRAWLDSVQRGSGRSSNASIGSIATAMSTILITAGAVLGISAALALFYYTGEQPINIINVLAVGVGLQLLLLMVFVLALLSRSPWLDNILSSFNAGRWAARLAYFLPALKKSLNIMIDSNQSAIDEHIIKWQTIAWSQQFALAFNVALLSCCLYLVTFSDLAFGWSTTLGIDSNLVKHITDTLAFPWKSLFPAAVPQLELIDATRFYRLQTITMGTQENELVNQAQLAGNWWRFLFLCLVVYGFIPRLMTSLYTRFKLAHTVKQSILCLPGLHLLLDRMNTPAVATNAQTPESGDDLNQVQIQREVTALTGRESFILHWGQPAVQMSELSNWLQEATGASVIGVNTVASNNNENISELRDLPELRNSQVIAILVKAWEPPTLELTDWLSDLRSHYGNRVLIALVPYDMNAQSRLERASATDSRTWQDFLRRHDSEHIDFHGARA